MNTQTEIEFSELEKTVGTITKVTPKPRANKLTRKKYDLLEFKRILNQEPPKKLIKTNREYNNKFLPLQVVEQMLNAIFTAYQIEIPFAPQLMEGQVLTVVNIKVLHPVLKEWLTYSGLSSVPLIAADQENMKWNHRNIPASKGFAILNASKEIGQIFRSEKDSHADVMKDYFKDKIDKKEPAIDEERAILKNRLLKMIDASKTLSSIRARSFDVTKFKDKEVDEAYSSKIEELTKRK